jgi:hypothetical protein
MFDIQLLQAMRQYFNSGATRAVAKATESGIAA